jgi:hypothetical protein
LNGKRHEPLLDRIGRKIEEALEKLQDLLAPTPEPARAPVPVPVRVRPGR